MYFVCGIYVFVCYFFSFVLNCRFEVVFFYWIPRRFEATGLGSTLLRSFLFYFIFLFSSIAFFFWFGFVVLFFYRGGGIFFVFFSLRSYRALLWTSFLCFILFFFLRIPFAVGIARLSGRSVHPTQLKCFFFPTELYRILTSSTFSLFLMVSSSN